MKKNGFTEILKNEETFNEMFNAYQAKAAGRGSDGNLMPKEMVNQNLAALCGSPEYRKFRDAFLELIMISQRYYETDLDGDPVTAYSPEEHEKLARAHQELLNALEAARKEITESGRRDALEADYEALPLIRLMDEVGDLAAKDLEDLNKIVPSAGMALPKALAEKKGEPYEPTPADPVPEAKKMLFKDKEIFSKMHADMIASDHDVWFPGEKFKELQKSVEALNKFADLGIGKLNADAVKLPNGVMNAYQKSLREMKGKAVAYLADKKDPENMNPGEKKRYDLARKAIETAENLIRNVQEFKKKTVVEPARSNVITAAMLTNEIEKLENGPLNKETYARWKVCSDALKRGDEHLMEHGYDMLSLNRDLKTISGSHYLDIADEMARENDVKTFKTFNEGYEAAASRESEVMACSRKSLTPADKQRAYNRLLGQIGRLRSNRKRYGRELSFKEKVQIRTLDKAASAMLVANPNIPLNGNLRKGISPDKVKQKGAPVEEDNRLKRRDSIMVP